VNDQPPSREPAKPAIDVDALVAQYAPVGHQVRRKTWMQRGALVLLAPMAAFVAYQGAQWLGDRLLNPSGDPASLARIEEALAEFRDLKASITAETGSLRAQRAALEEQRQRFEAFSGQLVARLDEVNRDVDALARQRAGFEEQQSQLAQAIARADADRRALESRRADGRASSPDLDRQLAAISEQRRALEQQQQRFAEQGAIVAEQLARINSQRQEIERQRQAIEQQRNEVQSLLDQLNNEVTSRLNQRAVGRGAPDAEPAETLAGTQITPSPAPGPLATLAAVNHDQLGDVRGGIDVGSDLTIAIGIVRTASINGVEQFSTSLQIADLASMAGSGLPTSGIDPIVVQNGAGNLISLDSLNSFSAGLATVIQNTLDNQTIATQTVMDVSLGNMSLMMQDITASQAVNQSLSLQR
jgi:hypothetical protein